MSKQQQGEWILSSVHDACIQWATMQIAKYHPQARQPAAIAEQIVSVMEAHDVPIEPTIRWIEHAPHDAGVDDFTRWAAAYAAERAENDRRYAALMAGGHTCPRCTTIVEAGKEQEHVCVGTCAHCGAEVEIARAKEHVCGERR